MVQSRLSCREDVGESRNGMLRPHMSEGTPVYSLATLLAADTAGDVAPQEIIAAAVHSHV